MRDRCFVKHHGLNFRERKFIESLKKVPIRKQVFYDARKMDLSKKMDEIRTEYSKLSKNKDEHKPLENALIDPTKMDPNFLKSWYIYNGYSRHMTNDVSKSKTLHRLDGDLVTFDNAKSIKVEKINSVLVENTCELVGVKLINGISTNLVSV